MSKKRDKDKEKPKGTHQVKADDVEKTLASLAEMTEAAEKLRKRIKKAAKKRKPRGVRTTLNRMSDLVDVLKATCTVADLFKCSGQEALNVLDESGLLMEVKTGGKSMERLLGKMKEQAKLMKTALEADNDDDADDAARELHKLGISLEIKTQNYANCTRKASRFYPGEHGQLTLFSRLCMLEDEESIARINRTLRMNDNPEIAVEDADAMIAAQQAGDDEAVEAILTKAIEAA